MNSKERLLTVLQGKIPDCVPASPDFSNMIPVRLTGKPFWDIYLYNDPPIQDAYIACAKHFNIDSLMDGHPFVWPSDPVDPRPWEQFIVHRDAVRIVTQASYLDNGRRIWHDKVDVYNIANPPVGNVDPSKLGLPATPTRYEPVTGAKPIDYGIERLHRSKQSMGNQGLIGVFIIYSSFTGSEEAIYYYADHPEELEKVKEQRMEEVDRRFADLMAMRPEDRPDFICVGGSGTLVFQTPAFFHDYAFPAVKRAIDLATAAGIPTHIHSCGPEKELVRIMAQETSLTVIDPLEIPPMGDCDLAELKRLYGANITLKGNLHTTEVMLKGRPEDVVAASRKAIDDAAAGGRFILSTGDQCGRDTPDENLFAMIETARTYGKY